MKAIIWVSVTGVVFWWMMIDRPGRETAYHGVQYFFVRIGSVMGIQQRARTSDTTAAMPTPVPSVQQIQLKKQHHLPQKTRRIQTSVEQVSEPVEVEQP